ncbi:MAG: hypothetical protein K5917_04930, partial [Clostridiales bacterium]|nr:hypothetical protein [Clostridiales bacterium]
ERVVFMANTISSYASVYNYYYNTSSRAQNSVLNYGWPSSTKGNLSTSFNNSISTDFLNNTSSYSVYKTKGYRNLTKSLYQNQKFDTKTNNTAATSYKALETATADLKKSAKALSASDNFATDKDDKIDKPKLAKLAEEFVENYNKTVKNSSNVENLNSLQRTKFLINDTNANKNLLSKVGITINKDDTLSIDKEKFSKANDSDIKTLFEGNYSYASKVEKESDSINKIVEKEMNANKKSYQYQYTNGSLLDYSL